MAAPTRRAALPLLHLPEKPRSCLRSTSSPKSTRSRSHNAVDQTNKEVSTRFDFKGSDARIELKESVLTLFADDDFKLSQVTDILTAKLTKRGVDIRSLKYGDVEKISGNKVKQAVTVREGVEQELAKKIVRVLKDSKMKVQGSIQGEVVRVSGGKRDDLQSAIALIKKSITDFPLQYKNFRD